MTVPNNITTQKLERLTKRLLDVENAQDDNFRDKKILEQTKEFIEADRLQSRLWIEQYEQMITGSPNAQGKVAELLDTHARINAEISKGLDDAFANNAAERLSLENERDQLIANQKQAMRQKEAEMNSRHEW